MFHQAATVICLRRTKEDSWEVLLGQNVVKNWLRSSEDRDVIMRYTFEFELCLQLLWESLWCNNFWFSNTLSLWLYFYMHFGKISWRIQISWRSFWSTKRYHSRYVVCLRFDKIFPFISFICTKEDTALREFREEFGNFVAEEDMKITPNIFLFNMKYTLLVKEKQYCMHNYVALDEDNPWMADDSIVTLINEQLTNRYDRLLSSINLSIAFSPNTDSFNNIHSMLNRFNQLLQDGTFWQLDSTEKEVNR